MFELKMGPVRRLWSHRRTRVAILCLAALAVVVLIIWGIRLAHEDPGSGSSSATTATQATSSHAHGAAAPSFVAPVTPDVLARYKGYAGGLQQANSVATKALVGAGSTPTQTQLLPAVAAYRTAVNLYDFQLRFIQWPRSMQSAITVDHAQLEALVSYLQSFPQSSPTNMSTWLSGLRNRDASTEAADNQVRHDLGLPSLSSFP